MKNVLLINAHQFYEGFAEGKLNKTMVGVMKEEMEAKGYEVKQTYIENGYDIINPATIIRPNCSRDLV